MRRDAGRLRASASRVLGATGSVGTEHARPHRPQSAPLRGRGADGPQQRGGAGRAGAAPSRLARRSSPTRAGTAPSRSGWRGAASRWRPAPPACSPRPCGRPIASWPASVGAAGLRPTLAAVSQGRRVALANKECLVLAGEIFMNAVRQAGTELVPVDSEHSAAFQSIAGADPASIERIVLTASGGPFRTWSLEELAHATPQQALVPPQLVHGAQDHHQLCHPDEQGAGADRGLSPLPRRARPARGGGASRSRSFMRWWPIATVRCWRSWPAPTCARRSR